ncbi:non-heme iron oxygenase ferredoxin subunit [Paraburkholderia ginsengiterrae]|uniref:Rieske domain-containing protein n=2 Tax=Paraburkholderia ginsengiterrae TaxID=1462993 RepID=A0A1A9MXU8_9BURK|nr:non-heme iron oxygenase ferredoxin subunit [Paraburkholderia ginsengiterrae]OAJ52211.1 hypothetical protein A6V37_10290 [Paraburkholderia ginsengiterrae]
MEKRIFLCQKSAVPANGVVQVCPEGRSDGIAVYDVEGKYYATEDMCTHGMVALSGGDLEGATIFCPLHGGAFDVRTGEALEKPCTIALKTFQIFEEGDALYSALD